MSKKVKIKYTIIGLSGVFLSWLGTFIGVKIGSEFLIAFSWFITFIFSFELGKRIEKLKWRGLK